ncbi:MAG: phage tail tape measure protein, partial [Allosphingosinicella sp.]
AARRGLEYASSLGEVAQQVGVTTKTLQEYRYVGSQVGITNDVIDKGLAKLTRTIGEAATGGAKQGKVFKALGIDIRDAGGHVRDTGEIIPELADALNRIPDAARRAAVEAALFGKAGQQLDTLLAGGSHAVNELRDAAHRLGVVLSDEQIQRADDTADKLSAMKQVLEARIAGTVADNAESILALVDALSQLVVWAGKATVAWRSFWIGQEAAALQRAADTPFIGPKRRMALLEKVSELRGEQLRLSQAYEGRAQSGPAGVRSKTKGSGGALALDDLGGGGGGTGDSRTDQQVYKAFRAELLKVGINPTSGKRSTEEQAALYRKLGPGNAAPPGTSDHELWKAFDFDPNVDREKLALAAARAGVKLGPELVHGGKGGRGRRHLHQTFDKGTGGGGEADLARLAEEEERQRKDKLRQDYDLASQDRRNQIDILRAQQDLSGDYVERTELGTQILNLETAQEKAALKLGVDLGEISQTRAEELSVQVDRLAELKRLALLEDQEQRRLEDVAKLEDVRADIARDRLDGELQLAETQSERRRIELEILALTYAERKAALERAMAASRDEEEKERLHQQIGALGPREAQDKEAVLRGTAGPLESYMRSLPTDAAKMNEALEEVAVGGLRDVTDGLAEASASWIKMRGVAGNTLREIYTGIMKILIARFITAPLAQALGVPSQTGQASAGGGGGFWSTALSVGSSLASLFGNSGVLGGKAAANASVGANIPGLAGGGTIRIRGMAGVDKNLLSLNGSPLARVSRGEDVRVSPTNDAGPAMTRVTIIPTPYFDAHVDDRATRVAAPMAGRAAVEGSSLAQRQMAGRRRRALP